MQTAAGQYAGETPVREHLLPADKHVVDSHRVRVAIRVDEAGQKIAPVRVDRGVARLNFDHTHGLNHAVADRQIRLAWLGA